MKNMTHTPTNAPARICALEETGTRFWYWTGASGGRYITSVYDAATCPPLPGAIYIAARRGSADHRQALACGLLPRACGQALEHWRERIRAAGAQEVHVHLLAASPADALRIRDDICANLGLEPDNPGAAQKGAKSRRGLRETASRLVLCG